MKSHLAQSLQQDRDARQSLGSPLVVTVTKHKTHQLRISGTHRLLKNCRMESQTEPITQASFKMYEHEEFKGGQQELLIVKWAKGKAATAHHSSDCHTSWMLILQGYSPPEQ